MNKLIYPILAIIFLFVPLTSVFAQNYNVNLDFDNAVCVGSNIKATANVTNNGTLTILTKTEPCPFGCDLDNNRCNPAPFDVLVYYVIGGIIAVFLIILGLARLSK